MINKITKLLDLDDLEYQKDDAISQYYIGTKGNIKIRIKHNNKKIYVKNELNQWIFKGWIN